MDRKGRCGTALSAALFSRSEPYREGLGKTQTTASRGQGSKQGNSRSGHHRGSPTHHPRQRPRLVQTPIGTLSRRLGQNSNNCFARPRLEARKLSIRPSPRLSHTSPPPTPTLGSDSDRNPIEKAWAKLKQLLRAAKARSKETLDQAITEALPHITPANAHAWFRLTLNGLQ